MSPPARSWRGQETPSRASQVHTRACGDQAAEHFLAFVGIAAALIGYRRLTN